MLSFTQHTLHELFDQPAVWRWITKTATERTATFAVSTTGAPQYYRVKFELLPRRMASLSFGRSDVYRGMEYDLTKDMGAAASVVMATVIDIVKNFLTSYRPTLLEFSSWDDAPSRIKLYRRLTRNVSHAIPAYGGVITRMNRQGRVVRSREKQIQTGEYYILYQRKTYPTEAAAIRATAWLMKN